MARGAYFVIDDFKAGLDVTHAAFNSPAGSLRVGTNVHINRAGEVEVRKHFAPAYTLPAGTFGLAGTSGALYTFGSTVAPSGIPSGITYQRLNPASGSAMTAVLQVELFNGKFFVSAKFANGAIADFYDGTEVTDTGFVPGAPLKTLKNKMYVAASPNLQFSEVGDPTHWNPAVYTDGAGFANLSNETSGVEDLKGLSTYYRNLVIFSREGFQIWEVFADDVNNRSLQVTSGVGLIALRACLSYFDSAVWFWSDMGIRLLKARDSSNYAIVSDVGSPIDSIVTAHQIALSDTVQDQAIMCVEPRDGRLWAIMGDKVFVYSFFPSRGVAAWTTYEPGFQITDVATVNRRLYCRSGDAVYLYGGETQEEYSADYVSTIRLPYVAAGAPATFKNATGLDLGVEGEWTANLFADPAYEDAYETIAIVDGPTFSEQGIDVAGYSTHFSLELVHQKAEYARLSSVGLHFAKGETS